MTLARALKGLIAAIAICMSVYHLTVAFIGAPQQMFFRSTRLLFALALVFLLYPSFRKKPAGGIRDDAGGMLGGGQDTPVASWWDWLLIAASLAIRRASGRGRGE